jgi:hypothetical protein
MNRIGRQDELDRQNGTSRAEQANRTGRKRDRRKRAGVTGHLEWNRQNSSKT